MIILGDDESLPNGWKWCEVGKVIDVRDGTHDSPKPVETGVPLVTSKNLKNGEIDFSTCNKISEVDHEAISKRSAVDDGDILYAMIGTIGSPVLVKKECDFSIKNVALFKFKGSEVFNRYFYHLLNSSLVRNQFEKNTRGGTQKFVSLGNIRALQIPLPPLAEQKRIAAILDKADAIRQKRKQAIELADEFLRSVFLDMFGDPVTNPKGWDIKKLADVTHKITDGEHGTVKRLDSGKLYLMARNITKDGKLDLSEVSYISHDDHDRIYKRCAVEENDLLLVCVGATIGKAALVPKMEEFSLARSVALLKPDLNLIEPEFLLQLVKTKWLQNEFINSGNSSAQAGLYLGKIKETEVPIPPIEMQRKFKEIHAKTTECMYLEDNFQCNASNLFESLSQKAFSGQL